MPLPVAVNGTISLQGLTRQGVTPQPLTKRAMIIRMSEETLEALAAYPAHPPLQFEFGDTPGIHIESTFFPMRGVQESTPHELYLRSALASKINAPLKLYADIAGKFTVERELNGKTQSKVQQSTVDAQKTKSERRIVFLDNPPALTSSTTKTKSPAPKKRKSAVSAPIAATVRRVPHVIRAKNEGSSATRGHSPNTSSSSSQSSPVPPAIRAQMIHLLAKGPRTKEDVLTQVGGPDASESFRVQLNELLVTVQRPNSKSAVPGQPPLYTLLPVSWKEVRPYEFVGLTDDERRKMWRHARQFLHSLGIPESDPAWDHVRTLPGSTLTGPSKTGTGPKRPAGPVGAERKKNAGSTSKAAIEAKDEGVRPSQTTKVREEAPQFSRATKVAPKREDDDLASRRPPGVSGPRNARETAPSQSQSQTQTQGPSKKAGLADARAKHADSSKSNGRPDLPAPIQPSTNSGGNTAKRRKVDDDDRPYKPGGGGGGTSKARERDRDKETDPKQDKARDRDPVPRVKRLRDSDRASPDTSHLSRKSAVRERDRLRDHEPDRSVSPLGFVKREPSLSPALHSSHLRESSPRLRASKKRTDTPPREARSSSPSRSQARARDRDRESSANGVSTTRRRRSPIYTSSEDEQHEAPIRRNEPPSSATSSSSSREPGRSQGYASNPLPPTAPYPKDREALQARYRSGYRNYIGVYYKLSEERAKIQEALEGFGREGSVGSDRDVEMMDEGDLRELAGQHAAWTRELEGLRNAYSAEGERMDIAT
ncbi:hypothetical protein F5148DRAFT_983707 [Russula earlei]|uniref:Uncharacterized protein n=1 Tax=Russula earlei TaxID=71964 RepID=A0ACC0U3N6_9AGAM|nr:hypothetical protein F5148DRAFT_983707 [Russula earlei]